MATITTELIESKQDERGRRMTSAVEREAVIRAYEESALTQKAFAKREGIKYTTFVSWVQEARRGGGQRKVGFAEVTMTRAPAALEVQLPDGITVRGHNAEEVARLLRLIRC
jgi:transposase-like protein